MYRLEIRGMESTSIKQHTDHDETEESGSNPFDKLREECGVVAVHGHPDASRQAYLALYALQHRGQESAGIATADYTNLYNIKGMGLVADIFTDDVLSKLPGELAIGHTRYSTTGDSALLNAQPIRVDSTRGLIAIAHNGNLVNLGTLRTRLEREGAYFQTTSDSEIIVQLIAHSNAKTLIEAIGDSLRQVSGAFSIVMMTRDRIFAARDPYGFRPLSMGRIRNPDGPDTVVFASETCAFDLLRAKYERDVRPGEVVMLVTRDGVSSVEYATGVRQASCIFEHVYFARPDEPNLWPMGASQPGADGTAPGARSAGRSRPGGAGAGLRRDGCSWIRGGERDPFQFRAHTQPLRGAHVYRAGAAGARLRGEAEAEPGAQSAGGQTHHPDRRLHYPWHHQPQDRAHGALCGSPGSASSHQLPAQHLALLLRSRHAQQE